MIRALALAALVGIVLWTSGLRAESAVILSPTDGDETPRAGIDPPCDANGFCRYINVRGRVPPGYWPFVAVRPETSNPRFWLQRRVTQVGPDGTFETQAGLGPAASNVGLKFDIFVIAHRDPARFATGEIQFGLPEECRVEPEPVQPRRCVVSDHVTIKRTR